MNGYDPKPACQCNVFDHRGRVIAWRTWACPLHKWGAAAVPHADAGMQVSDIEEGSEFDGPVCI